MTASRFLTLAQIRQIESEAEIKLDLMAEAGAMIAQWIEHDLAKASKILVLVGGGNNGGDGVAAAINLKRAGYAVSLLCVTEKINPRIDQLITQFKQLQGQVLVKLPKTFAKYTVIVDAILGIGLDRDLDDQLMSLVKQVNASGKFILAIDTPTGLNPFSGGVMNTAIQANHTLTFISDKPGFYTGDGVDLAGKVTVVPLVKLENYVLTPNHAPILGNELVQINYQALIRRHRNTNKGDFGTVAIIGGGPGMQGALHLAGRAALLM
ncbi:MAG: NAD(P)H-hydrate epimerase, partial [Burkholderiales bacterium]